MPVLRILMDADGMADTKDPDKLIMLDTPITVGFLKGGMESGKASVAFMFDLPDGKTVIAQTSMDLFLTAARAYCAKFGGTIFP